MKQTFPGSIATVLLVFATAAPCWMEWDLAWFKKYLIGDDQEAE